MTLRERLNRPGDYALAAMAGLGGAAVLALLFHPALDQSRSSPIVNALWNAGHIPLFGLAALLWLRFRERRKSRSFKTATAEILILGTGLGLAIELLQWLTGRMFSPSDILRNTCGLLLALAFYPHRHSGLPRCWRGRLRAAAIVLTLAVLAPLWAAVADRVIRHYQYPVLSDFETPLESLRWLSTARTRIIEGEHSRVLEVTMRPRSGYSTLDLMDFHGDWSQSRALALQINSTAGTARRLTLRIHDRKHERGVQAYADRYNKSFELAPGWNRLVIATDEIKNAPADRAMDLTQIVNMQLFTSGLAREWTFHIDNVRLITGEPAAPAGRFSE
jgi:VanZ family protein